MPLALGVLSPSVLGPLFTPLEADPFAGEKNSGDCVEAPAAWSLLFLGVACELLCSACEASEKSCSSGPPGAGLLEGICEFLVVRALLRGVAEAVLRGERRCAGDDMIAASNTDKQLEKTKGWGIWGEECVLLC